MDHYIKTIPTIRWPEKFGLKLFAERERFPHTLGIVRNDVKLGNSREKLEILSYYHKHFIKRLASGIGTSVMNPTPTSNDFEGDPVVVRPNREKMKIKALVVVRNDPKL